MVIGCRNSDSSCENQHILSSNDNSKVQPSSRQSPQPSTTATSSPINSLSPGQLPVPKSQNATVGSRGADGWFIDSSIPPLRDPVILREQVESDRITRTNSHFYFSGPTSIKTHYRS